MITIKKYSIEDLEKRKKVCGEKVKWFEFDIHDLLPNGWEEYVKKWSMKNAVRKFIVPTSVTSREKDRALKLPIAVISGDSITLGLPWLFEYYETLFLDCANLCYADVIRTARLNRYAVNLNLQRGNMRYEAHVDSNPVEGLLYVTTHPEGTGGELVVSRNKDALGPEEIDESCEIIHPKSGTLLFFDYRDYPHYTKELKKEDSIRIVVAMNYYTDSCTENDRPEDLDKHLYGVGLDW